MKTSLLIRFISMLLLWSLNCHAYAQQWYHVELIVFEQLNTYTDEKWPAMADVATAPLNPDIPNNHIQPASNNSLLDTAASLNRSTNYQVHYHKSWLQDIMLKHSAEAINVQSSNGIINGSIKLYKATHLHATLDLWLVQNEVRSNSWTDLPPEDEILDVARDPNLVESRRIRSKKLYFFDHPKMGALLQLTPIDTPDIIQASEETLENFPLPNEATPTTNE